MTYTVRSQALMASQRRQSAGILPQACTYTHANLLFSITSN